MTPALSVSRRTGRIAAPAGLALAAAVAGSLAAASMIVPTAASAAPGHAPHGRVDSAWQNTATHKLHVDGFAYDGGAGQTRKPVRVSLFVNGHYKRSVTADRGSKRYDGKRDIHGRHRFATVIDVPHKAEKVRLQAHAAGQGNATATVDSQHVRQHTPATDRIVHVARKYVGSRYIYGADGPSAFDCSGYSKFVYKKAHVAQLPHNSQAQRHAGHMHRIARSHARPGDLVFYLSGGSAYHVAIFAGHGKQYSATDPSQGVEHSEISSHNVIFETDWH